MVFSFYIFWLNSVQFRIQNGTKIKYCLMVKCSSNECTCDKTGKKHHISHTTHTHVNGKAALRRRTNWDLKCVRALASSDFYVNKTRIFRHFDRKWINDTHTNTFKVNMTYFWIRIHRVPLAFWYFSSICDRVSSSWEFVSEFCWRSKVLIFFYSCLFVVNGGNFYVKIENRIFRY